MVVRTVIQRGPKEKKVAAFAIDWPGWSRGAKAPDAAFELLEAYRERYRPIARLAGLEAEFDRAGDLEIVEDHVGVGSTDFWGISFAPSSFEQAPMPEDELERKVALLEAAWRFFDDVAARVSPETGEGAARRRSQPRRDRPPRPPLGAGGPGEEGRRGTGPPATTARPTACVPTARHSSPRCATTTPRGSWREAETGRSRCSSGTPPSTRSTTRGRWRTRTSLRRGERLIHRRALSQSRLERPNSHQVCTSGCFGRFAGSAAHNGRVV